MSPSKESGSRYSKKYKNAIKKRPVGRFVNAVNYAVFTAASTASI
jgi:hypothetical protein